MPALRRCGAGTCRTAIGQFENRRAVCAGCRAEQNDLCFASLYPKVAAGVDHRARRAESCEAFRGAVHGESLGNSAQIYPKRATEPYAVSRKQLDV